MRGKSSSIGHDLNEPSNGKNPQVFVPRSTVKKYWPILIVLIILCAVFLGIRLQIVSRLQTYISQLIATPNVLYPLRPDPTGRNVYYVLNDIGGRNLKYAGVGTFYIDKGAQLKDLNNQKTLLTVSSSTTVTNYIVGSFVQWINIPNSSDRYLVLQDKLNSKDQKSTETYPLIRVGFSTQASNFDPSKVFETGIGVENLDSVIPKTKDPSNGVQTLSLGLIGKISSNDLDKLIEPGDALSIVTKVNSSKNSDMVDPAGNAKIASWIFIRRFNPLQELSKELGHSINIQ